MQVSRPLRRLARPASTRASASDGFDSWLAKHPLPARGELRAAWDNSGDGGESTQLPAARSAGAAVKIGDGRRIHWQQAQQQAAWLARHHDVHWSAEHNGYICTPKAGGLAGAPPGKAAASHSSDTQQQQQQQQQQQGGTDRVAVLPPATPLLLALPPIMWTAKAAQLPLGRFHGLAASGAAPGSQLIALLSADSAALALVRNGEVCRHKVLTGYTVRKNRNGKAQLTHKRSSPGGPPYPPFGDTFDTFGVGGTA